MGRVAKMLEVKKMTKAGSLTSFWKKKELKVKQGG
jgi:hypothetical protein